MKKEDWKDKEIRKLLQEMPKVTDEIPKVILYEQISKKLTDDKPAKNQKIKLIPVFTTLVAIFLLSVIPFLINDRNQIANNYALDYKDMENTNESTEIMISEDSLEKSGEESTIADYHDSTELEMGDLETIKDSNVVHSVGNDSSIVFAAVADKQFQYVIPVSFIVPNKNSLNENYKQLDNYMKEEGFSSEYLFEGASYEIEPENKEVKIQLPTNFSIDSSAEANLFKDIIQTMFSPYGIEKAVLISEGEEPIDLGPIGQINELRIQESNKASYKLYNSEYLVPVPHQLENNISDAIMEMKNSEEAFNLTKTIPDSIHFSVESFDSELDLFYTGDSVIEETEESITMIEAILMTAKSYGFETVRFNEMGIDAIGHYNMNEPIQVPTAVNPIVK
ncbi:hypothetical protein D8M04_02560 [Oceanobacillus piezotolerans]|uniref:GerMN domain-containing protein n=1 Tax=Oceanobacillus piezotolerans TaxID=2448030 RepID=A0A498DF72_9BACI|nr:hypothetical protein [Oceanobacillus piezotolerans]RLL48175.1 hypothetical protein D8M04_02560 [Oceanobacillus piezotolerans]